MYFPSVHSADIANSVSSTLPGLPRSSARSQLPGLAVLALTAALVLFFASWLLPAALSQLALDLMSWCLVGAIAAGTLLASVKLIDSVLDL